MVSFDVGGGEIFGYGSGGYCFGLLGDGTPFLGRVEVSHVSPSATITDTNFHHLPVTKAGTSVVFYDGVAYAAPAYNTTFTFSSSASIGARGDNLANSFLGMIDEVSVYNRALSSGEVQAIYSASSAGKCLSGSPPLITGQTGNQTVTVGETASFSVTALGSAPLSSVAVQQYEHRWRNGVIIGGVKRATCQRRELFGGRVQSGRHSD